MAKRDRNLVWSSEGGGRPRDNDNPGPASPSPVGDGTVRVGRETGGRRGKAVTVITGLALAAAELDELARELKKLCGTGGTVRDGAIEIQGDQRDRVVAALAERGFEVKRAGG